MPDHAVFHRCIASPAGANHDFPAPDALRGIRQITVEAWLHTDGFRPEAMQPIVSCWTPKPTLDTFSAHDAGLTDGLSSVGFSAGAFDGRAQSLQCVPREGDTGAGVQGRSHPVRPARLTEQPPLPRSSRQFKLRFPSIKTMDER